MKKRFESKDTIKTRIEIFKKKVDRSILKEAKNLSKEFFENKTKYKINMMLYGIFCVIFFLLNIWALDSINSNKKSGIFKFKFETLVRPFSNYINFNIQLGQTKAINNVIRSAAGTNLPVFVNHYPMTSGHGVILIRKTELNFEIYKGRDTIESNIAVGNRKSQATPKYDINTNNDKEEAFIGPYTEDVYRPFFSPNVSYTPKAFILNVTCFDSQLFELYPDNEYLLNCKDLYGDNTQNNVNLEDRLIFDRFLDTDVNSFG